MGGCMECGPDATAEALGIEGIENKGTYCIYLTETWVYKFHTFTQDDFVMVMLLYI